MFLVGTYSKPLDNAGAKYIKCIKIFGGLRNKTASLGGIIKVIVKKAKTYKKIKCKKMYKSVVVNIKKNTKRKDGTYLKFNQNRVVLLSDKNKVLGKRIKGIIPFEIKKNPLGIRFKKTFKYAEYII